jgi:hypothetical protein
MQDALQFESFERGLGFGLVNRAKFGGVLGE